MDFQPTLNGTLLHLRPLHADDRQAFFAVASDPLIWEQYPNPLRWRPEHLTPYLEGAIESKSTLAVCDRASGALIGSSRYYEWDPAARSVAIGYTFLARAYWGGRYNGELKRLMLDHAFGFADTVIFHIGESNLRSRRAVEKIGASFAGLTEKVVDGKTIPYTVYRISNSRPPNR